LPLPFAGNPIGKPFIELRSIDSTNKYAMGLVHGDHLPDGQGEAQHGMAVLHMNKQPERDNVVRIGYLKKT
jgi:hypothetical protein